MKHLKQIALCLLLTFSLVTSAFAAEVPDSLVVENLNGQQRMVKTYVLSPETDPETLKEPSFDYDGFTYTGGDGEKGSLRDSGAACPHYGL